MKKIFSILLAVSVTTVPLLNHSLADHNKVMPSSEYASTFKRQEKVTPGILLFEAPTVESPVIAKINPDRHRYFEFLYRQGDWAKIMDRVDNVEGWIYYNQYSQALRMQQKIDFKRELLMDQQRQSESIPKKLKTLKKMRSLKSHPMVNYYYFINPSSLSPKASSYLLTSSDKPMSYYSNILIKAQKQPGSPAQVIAFYNGKPLSPKQSEKLFKVVKNKLYKMKQYNLFFKQLMERQQEQLLAFEKRQYQLMMMMLKNSNNMSPSANPVCKKIAQKSYNPPSSLSPSHYAHNTYVYPKFPSM